MATVGRFGLISTDSTNGIDAFLLQRRALIVSGHDNRFINWLDGIGIGRCR
jgi:hypothetical protein